MSVPEMFSNRILIIDDNTAIHEDFRKIFRGSQEGQTPLLEAERLLFGSAKAPTAEPSYLVDSAYQGLEGLELIRRAANDNKPYALAFVDVRMPPGLDGIETIKAIWNEYPELQVAICTAYSDYSWEDMLQCLGTADNLLILKKPFDNIEVRQIACALTAKWNLNWKRQQAEEERKCLHVELMEKNRLLEDDIVARKHVQIELTFARKTAEQANEAKSAFLANMSHEIRTPMNAIIGMTYLMKQTTMTLKQTDYLAKIDYAAHNLLGIITDILDFSKIEAGKIELEHIECSLESVLSQLTQLTALQAQQKKLEFNVCVAPDTPQTFIGDPLRLGQVLLNLASNAIKFTEKGMVDLSVDSAYSDRPENVAIRFTVKDSGVGMDEQQMTRLFQPFMQADISTARRFGGTGLGLAISNRFVSLMGGSIEVQSKPGLGSTFSFVAQFGRSNKAVSGAHTTSGNLPCVRRALVIQGADKTQHDLSTLLKDMSFEVISVQSYENAAREMTRVSEAHPAYDLVFVYCSSTDTNWVEEAKAFKQSCIELAPQSLPALILVVSTNMSDLQMHVRDAGFNGVLIEPITRSSIYDTVIRASVCSLGGSASKASKQTASPTIDTVLRGAKILLVENNDVNQQVAVELLNIAGCDVTVASSGPEALAILFNQTAPDLDAVLMDIQMPEMDGDDVTRRIRAEVRFKQIPILAMTADAVSDVKIRCLAAGMNDFLSKPIASEDLYSKLAYWVNRTRTHSNAEIRETGHTCDPIREIDFEQGIKLVGGNRVIYKRALEMFRLKYESVDRVVDSALAGADRITAAAVLNTLGIAANRLGLNALRQSAAGWESGIKTRGIKPDVMSEARKDFQTTIRETMDYIASAP